MAPFRPTRQGSSRPNIVRANTSGTPWPAASKLCPSCARYCSWHLTTSEQDMLSRHALHWCPVQQYCTLSLFRSCHTTNRCENEGCRAVSDGLLPFGPSLQLVATIMTTTMRRPCRTHTCIALISANNDVAVIPSCPMVTTIINPRTLRTKWVRTMLMTTVATKMMMMK